MNCKIVIKVIAITVDFKFLIFKISLFLFYFTYFIYLLKSY